MPIEAKTLETEALSDAKRRLLAQRMKGAASHALQAERIQPRPAGSRTVLGPDQYNIWLDATLHPEEPAYNEIVTIFYAGELDAVRLEHAFNLFLARHEGWRTSYQLDQGEVLQVIHPEVRIKPLILVDLAHLPFAKAQAESNRLATVQAQAFLPLDAPPLLRATLVRLAPNDCRLHLTLSHLIFDGYSIRRTFLVELATLYAALEAGTEPNLLPVQLHYADYTHWRTQNLDSPHIQSQIDFWRRKLSGELPLLRLPSDRPRPAAITHRGSIERFTLSRELTEALRQLGKPYRASFYMTLLASFKALLFRYSGQNDIVIGSVADGRRSPELESMMGYMIDVFAVRSQPEASLPFSAYLTQVRQTLLESIGAAEVPFQRVVEAVGAKRDLSHAPIFQTLFVLEPPQEPYGKWSVSATEITLGASKYDLYVEADEHATHTGVSIDYSTDLFDAPTIRRMMGHWQTLLTAIVANPDTPLGDLPILTPKERETLLVRWNETSTPIPANTLHGLVQAQASRTPDAPALRFEAETLTYAQLEAEANLLAAHLQRAGAAPDTLAAVFLDRSHHLPAALLAVLKTGAAYMPLDPGTPAARIALCLEDGTPPVILTQRARLADLPASSATVLILEDLLASPIPPAFQPIAVDPQDLAYVIHTSGSTGRPKGVELRHAGVVNFLLSMQREPGFTAADTLVAVTTISFDIAVLELFLPLITGGTVVLASRETALDPRTLATLLVESRATVLQATPATWSALIGINWPGLPGLKALCGGEALKRSLADRLLALKLDLWNVYGPTETTIWSTLAHIGHQPGAIDVGRPIDNTTAYILDPQQNAVPINVPGELYLGGIGVARGYRNKPDLTAEKFVSPPIATGARLYRTGDYALYRENGAIEIQGRSDNQVKIRGYRIELEDVEVNLTQHPRVASAAARAWPDPEGGHRLCAYLTGVDGPPPDAVELRHYLRGRVADYMIPSDIVALPALPLTSNGKIDRKQLSREKNCASPESGPNSSTSSASPLPTISSISAAIPCFCSSSSASSTRSSRSNSPWLASSSPPPSKSSQPSSANFRKMTPPTLGTRSSRSTPAARCAPSSSFTPSCSTVVCPPPSATISPSTRSSHSPSKIIPATTTSNACSTTTSVRSSASSPTAPTRLPAGASPVGSPTRSPAASKPPANVSRCSPCSTPGALTKSAHPPSSPPPQALAVASSSGSVLSASNSPSTPMSSVACPLHNAFPTCAASAAISGPSIPFRSNARSKPFSTASIATSAFQCPPVCAIPTSSPTHGSATIRFSPIAATSPSYAPPISPSPRTPTPTAAGEPSPPAKLPPPSCPAIEAACSSDAISFCWQTCCVPSWLMGRSHRETRFPQWNRKEMSCLSDTRYFEHSSHSARQ
jgi:amino acid adenylation domain-containing protein